jgi:hypothetical protein
MKRLVISIVLAAVFGGIPVFAESRGVSGQPLRAMFAKPLTPASPQFRRRRHRRRRRMIMRRRRMRRRDQRHIYVILRRRRY